MPEKKKGADELTEEQLNAVSGGETYSFGPQGNTVTVVGDGITVTSDSIKLSASDAQALLSGQIGPDLSVVLNGKEITASSRPVTISFTVNGTASLQKIYVVRYVDGSWELEGAGGGPSVVVPVV